MHDQFRAKAVKEGNPTAQCSVAGNCSGRLAGGWCLWPRRYSLEDMSTELTGELGLVLGVKGKKTAQIYRNLGVSFIVNFHSLLWMLLFTIFMLW